MKLDLKNKYLVGSIILTLIISYIPINKQVDDTMMLGIPYGFFKINVSYPRELSFHFNPLAFLANIFIFFCLFKLVAYLRNQYNTIKKEKSYEK